MKKPKFCANLVTENFAEIPTKPCGWQFTINGPEPKMEARVYCSTKCANRDEVSRFEELLKPPAAFLERLA